MCTKQFRVETYLAMRNRCGNHVDIHRTTFCDQRAHKSQFSIRQLPGNAEHALCCTFAPNAVQ